MTTPTGRPGEGFLGDRGCWDFMRQNLGQATEGQYSSPLHVPTPHPSLAQGVVSFLGDFLTVLHRLDSAIPDDLDVSEPGAGWLETRILRLGRRGLWTEPLDLRPWQTTESLTAAPVGGGVRPISSPFGDGGSIAATSPYSRVVKLQSCLTATLLRCGLSWT